jgi:predicted DsbA family dithiol-disulfide isomerase|tara:strand:+ start:103 stop:738 length:636 start_codon:yes stop_codon:yes gene_type:complete
MIKIDIFSDTICPWCYIGKKRLNKAISKFPNEEFKITWRPFQLNPNMQADGMDRKEYLVSKFGSEDGANTVYESIHKEGLKEAVDFQFDKIQITPNSFNSHRLLALAYQKNLQNEIIEDLFQAYFLKGLDIGDPNTLLDIAKNHEINEDEFKQYLTDKSNIEPLANEEKEARKMGIKGVPNFIVNQQLVINGAQPVENFELIFSKILAQVN